jgi:hypothetical protein
MASHVVARNGNPVYSSTLIETLLQLLGGRLVVDVANVDGSEV